MNLAEIFRPKGKAARIAYDDRGALRLFRHFLCDDFITRANTEIAAVLRVEVSGAIFVANQRVVFVAVHGSPAVFRGLPVSFGLAVRLIHGNAGNRRHEIAHFPFFLHLFALPLDFPARL